MSNGTPDAEVRIDAPLVQGLLQTLRIDTRQRAVTLLDTGWDNALFEVAPAAKPGAELSQRLVVRLPRRQIAVALLRNEQHWLPRLFHDSPLPIPRPLRVGAPALGYPWPFSVLPFLPGVASDLQPPAATEAPTYAEFLACVHRSAPADAPHNPYRGVALANREAAFKERWRRCAPALPKQHAQLLQLWDRALAEPIDMRPTWLHGDPHARNMLVERGKITGVIDWGDLCAGDRANDLAGIWMNFHSAQGRRRAIARYNKLCPGVTDRTWRRAQGWAMLFAIMLIDTGRIDHPRHLTMGERTLANLQSDFAAGLLN